MTGALRVALLLAYLPLAHLAGSRQSGGWAVLALGSVLLMLLVEPLVQRRAWAWAVLTAAVWPLWLLSRTPWALVPVLLMPAMWLGLIGWMFGRTLRAGREPLVTRLVSALYGRAGIALSPRHLAYTRGLTAAWAGLLGTLAVLNLALALIAVPGGVLDRLGATPALQVTPEQWSLVANAANYGVIGGFMLIEYQLRKFVFPVRPYRNLPDFARQMAALGPAFWRGFLR